MRFAIVFVLSCFGFEALAQDPAPTSLPKEVCVISVDESVVPNILGFAPKEAKKIVEECGFVYDGAEDVHTLSYEAIGTVGDQQPSGGTIAKQGMVVRGFVSVGVYAPDFTGWSAVDAERFYRDLRHGVNIKEERNSAPVGTVFAQQPANAVLANSGPALTLYVSKGLYIDLSIHVTSVVGKDYNEAKRYLTGIGLNANHGGGYLEWTSKQITNCEWRITYPRVVSISPTGQVFEGDTISLSTEKATYYELFPEGSDGKDCD
jgi:beta-lactam-binding protein with PASTA domain